MHSALTTVNPRDPNLNGTYILAVKHSYSTFFTTIKRDATRQPETDMLSLILDKKPEIADDPSNITLAKIPGYDDLPALTTIIGAHIGNELAAALSDTPVRLVDNNLPVTRCHKYIGRFSDGEDAVILYQTAYASGISTFATINPIDGRAYDLEPDQKIQSFRGVMLTSN